MQLNLDGAAEAQANGSPISLPVLKLISEARGEHGMRQHDYERYRQFCTKKVHRLRQSIHLTHKDANRGGQQSGGKGQKVKRSKRKQTAATQSAADKAKGGNVFTDKTIDVAKISNDRPAQLYLFEAERAWSHSQDLRSQSNVEGQDPSLRKRGLGRARKSVHWAGELSKLVEALGQRVDVRSRAEIEAYALNTRGAEAFDKENWQKSLEYLSASRLLLSEIAKSSTESRGEALANSFVDSGEAQMRFCAYQLGEDAQDMDSIASQYASETVLKSICPTFSQLVQQLSELKSKKGDAEREALQIEWRDRTAPIRNPELMDVVQKVREQEASLRQALKAASSATERPARAKGAKPVRLSHTERKARKSGAASGVSGTSRSTNDPYDHAIAALTDGELVARRLVEDNAEALSKSHSARYEAVGEDLKFAHDWLQYRLLSLQIQRSLKLTQDVKEKAEKREHRKAAALEQRLARQKQRQTQTQSRAKKSATNADGIKPSKKPQPGSRAKKSRTTPKAFHRRPARSGTKRLHARQASRRAIQARSLAASQSRRRSARAIPALAKLLDLSEQNLIAISALLAIESDPDASTVIDAKAAWYRSELFLHLGRAHALANQPAEACLILRRAALSVRQARQSLDLVDDPAVVEEMDGDIPPALNEATLSKSEDAIAAALKDTQREIYFESHGRSSGSRTAAISLSQTKAGQQLRLLASRHIDFDPLDVQEAAQIDAVDEAEFRAELSDKTARRSGAVAPASRLAAPVHAASAGEDAHEEDHFQEAAVQEDDDVAAAEEHDDDDDEDEDFAPADEMAADHDHEEVYEDDEVDEEGDEASAGGAVAEEEEKKGWLGGWFGGGRKK